MKHLVAAAACAVFLATGNAQADTPIAEVAQLRMYSSFWQNLHHFLYVAAWARRTSTPVTQRLAMPLPQEPAPSLGAAEQAVWAEAVDYYDRTIASRDLLFDDELTRIKIALGEAGDTLSLGAHTSVNPRPHIVVASGDSSYAGWSGTEMLFHESSHALIFETRRAIDSAVRAAGKNPRDLWHVVLFYVAGEVTRQQLESRALR